MEVDAIPKVMPDPSAPPEAIRAVLEKMRLAALTRGFAQQFAADRAAALNRRLGAAATVLAAIGGTTAFASLAQAKEPVLVIVGAALSVLAAVVSGLQTYFNYGAVSGEHRKWAAQFDELARRIAFAQATPVDSALTEKRFERLNGDLTQFDKDSPVAPEREYQRARRRVAEG
jgi:hypothetical protein